MEANYKKANGLTTGFYKSNNRILLSNNRVQLGPLRTA